MEASMSEEKPMFSILISTKDRPEYVKWVLLSLKAQTYGSYEVLLLDDGTDHLCKGVFDEIAQGDKRYKYFRLEERMHLEAAWNYLIEHTSGKYLNCFEDKTLYRKDALMYISNVIKAENEPRMVGLDKNTYYRMHKGTSGMMEIGQRKGYYTYDPKEDVEVALDWHYFYGSKPEHLWRGNLLFGFYRKDLFLEMKDRGLELQKTITVVDITPRFIASVLCSGEKCVHILEPLFMFIDLENGGGRKVMQSKRYQEWGYQERVQSPVVKYTLPYIDYIVTSNYYAARECQYIIDLWREAGVYSGRNINCVGVIACIKREMETLACSQEDMTDEIREKERKTLENAISLLDEKQRVECDEIYQSLLPPRSTTVKVRLAKCFGGIYKLFRMIREVVRGNRKKYSSPMKAIEEW